MGLLIKLLGTPPSVPSNSLNIKSKICSSPVWTEVKRCCECNLGGQFSRIRLQVKKVGSVRIRGSTDQWLHQGGRCWGSAGAALHDRSGSSTTGRTPNIRYFVAKLGIVAIYALFERLS